MTTLFLGKVTGITGTFTTTSFADITGLTKTITVPAGVTTLKVSFYCDNINTNTGTTGAISLLQIIDDASTVIATTSSRQTSSYAAEDSASMVGFATVTPGSSKTYKVQGKLSAAGGSGGTVNVGMLFIEAVG